MKIKTHAMFFTLILILSAGMARGQQADKLAEHLLGLAGRRAGICSMPMGGDAALFLALTEGERLVVHAMSEDASTVDTMRGAVAASGRLGRRIYIERGGAAKNPLAGWTADLVLIPHATDAMLETLPQASLRRVASPWRGVVLVGRAKSLGAGLTKEKLEAWAKGMESVETQVMEDAMGLWAVMRMPAPEGADEWTHFQHNGGNNPVSQDTALQQPFDIQYITPPFTGAGGSSRFAGGRLFEMQGQQYKHGASRSLVGSIWCRNAYNGQILWEMQLPDYVDAKQLTAVATADAFYLLDDDKPGVQVIDPETGVLLKKISLGKEGEQCKWFAIDQGRLVALIGKLAPAYPEGSTYHGSVPKDYRQSIVEGKLNHGLRVTAWDLKENTILWDFPVDPDRIDPRAIAAWDGKVAFLVEAPQYEITETKSSAEKVIGKRLVCLSGGKGDVLWENADAALSSLERQYQFIFGREYFPGLIASSDGVRLRLMGIYSNDIFILDPDSGSLRWSIGKAEKRYGGPETFAGFFVDGKYYHQAVFDSLTGERDESIGKKDIWDGGCGVRTWSPVGIFGNANGRSVGMDVKSDCHMGSFVAGGLLNVPRGWCDCSPVWRGTFAFASRKAADVHAEFSEYVLERGPGQTAETVMTSADWPTYRHDNDRTAGTPVSLPEKADLLWAYQQTVPYDYVAEHEVYAMRRQDQPTEPVAVDGMVYFAGSDGKVSALDASSGKEVWTYWTGGRIYAPPLVADGGVYVGSEDGWLYCLNARSGELVWRFLAAPHEQRIMLAEHLRSRWPILTGPLFHEGVVYCVAGMVDIQGVHVYALDAKTGEVRWHNGEAGKTGADRESSLTPDGFMTVMGSRLYVRSREGLIGRFHLATGQRDSLPDYPNPRGWIKWDAFGPMGREVCVLGNGYILEGGRSIWHDLNQRTGDRGWPSFWLKRFDSDGEVVYRSRVRLSAESIIPPAFDADGMAMVPGGFGRYMKDGVRVESPGPRGTLGLLMLDKASVLQMAESAAMKSKDFDSISEPTMNVALNGEELGRGKGPENYPEMYRESPAFRWQFEEEWVQVNAVALAKNAVVFTRGSTQEGGGLDPDGKWTVLACDRNDGRIFWEIELPMEPMLNGLCIDRDGRVIVTLRDGGAVAVGSR